LRRRDLLALCAVAAPLRAQTRLAPVDEAGYRKVLQAGRGQVLLVDFWATWCQPCRVELPQLVKLEAKHRSRGLKLITISCDEPEQEADAARFLQECQVRGPAYIKRAASDDRFIASVDAAWSGALPALFLYDRQGRQARTFVGEAVMTALEAALAKLI
jgi:thiol-disulfide isomerase/thioredoxin